METKNRLWTRDFSLITIGTIISMVGQCVASFSLGLLVYQNTESTLLYAIYTTVSLIPYIIISFFAGPFLDRFSRKIIIVFLDYLTGLFYIIIALMYLIGWTDNYWLILVLGFIIGSQNALYQIAYDSFYPTLVSKGNYSKAYSISSMIYPIASTLMVPLAAFLYKTIGVEYLFIGSGILFTFTATFELFITTDKPALEKTDEKIYKISYFFSDLKEGLSYLKKEKGLKYITIYFIFNMMAYSAFATMLLPFFESSTLYTIQDYSFIMAIGALGRVIGAIIHYFKSSKPENNYKIALFVYIATSILQGAMLFSTLPIMYIISFICGFLAVTSFTIRTSSTQNYVPNEKRGRFNSLFYMATTGLGSVTGQLLSGALGEVTDLRWIVFGAMAINMVATLVFVVLKKDSISKVYNVAV